MIRGFNGNVESLVAQAKHYLSDEVRDTICIIAQWQIDNDAAATPESITEVAAIKGLDPLLLLFAFGYSRTGKPIRGPNHGNTPQESAAICLHECARAVGRPST